MISLFPLGVPENALKTAEDTGTQKATDSALNAAREEIAEKNAAAAKETETKNSGKASPASQSGFAAFTSSSVNAIAASLAACIASRIAC